MEGQRIKIGEIYIPEHRDQGWQPVEKIIWPKPEAPILPTSADKRSIFVAIAAFRDGSRCGKTLYDLETKAKHPSRVAVGIVQQNEEGDADCLERYCELMESNGRVCDVTGMRLLNLPAQESQGPVWGRHWQQYLLGDEEFCMQIDSHMAFASNWDEKVLGDWELAQNEFAVLSTYVPDVKEVNNMTTQVPHICEVEFKSQIRNANNKALRDLSEPKITSTWCAGYSLSKCHAMRAVPYDPYLPQIFDGEEFSMFARLWTRGYDVYTPSRNYVFHDYSRSEAIHAADWSLPKRSESHIDNVKLKDVSNVRLWTLLGMPGGSMDPKAIEEVRFGPWGLGRARSLSSLAQFTSLDFEHKSFLADPVTSCGLLSYVPVESPAFYPGSEDNIAHAPYWARVRELLPNAHLPFRSQEADFQSPAWMILLVPMLIGTTIFCARKQLFKRQQPLLSAAIFSKKGEHMV